MRFTTQKPLLLILLSFVVSSLFAQSTNWIRIANDQSSAKSFAKLSDGNFLISSNAGEEFSTNKVAKVSALGDQSWERNICDCNERYITFSSELSSLELIHVTGNGRIFKTNAEGENPVLINQFLPDTLSNELFGAFRSHAIKDDIVYFTGRVEISDTTRTVRTSLNLRTLDITSKVNEYIGFPYATAYSNTGMHAELYNSFLTPNLYFFDANQEVISSLTLSDISNYIFTDISFDEIGNLYLVGINKSRNIRITTGAIGLIDTSFTLLWTKEILTQPGDTTISLHYVTHLDDKIFIGGNVAGFSGLKDAHIGEIDRQGNFLWTTTFDLIGENDDVSNIDFANGSSRDELIVLGTGGLTDFGGPQRTYLASININTSSTSMEPLAETPLFYPSPVADLLHFDPTLKFT